MRLGVLLLALLFAPPVQSQSSVHPESSRGTGSISGKVDFKGRARKPEKARSSDPACAGAVSVWEPRAVVRLTTNAPAAKGPSTPVILEAKGCMYRPRLQAAMKGQKILLRNPDGTTHSVRAAAVNGRAVFNVIQPPGSKDLEKDPLATDVLTITCDLHPWMKAFVVISEHPYFAVTADDGSFEIKDVPAGSYGIEAWNDRLGVLKAEVTVQEGQAADPKFVFTGK